MSAAVPPLEQVVRNYVGLYVLPEWCVYAETVLALFADEIKRTESAQPVTLDPNDVDAFVFSLVQSGHGLAAALAVLADAMEFLVSRGVLSSNPLLQAVSGRTTRLGGNTRTSDLVRSEPMQPAVPVQRRMAFRTAIDYFFPVIDLKTGLRNCRNLGSSTIMTTYLPKWLKLADWLDRHGVQDVGAVSRHHIKSFVDTLPSTKPQTRNSYIYALRALWREFVDDGLVTSEQDPTQISKLKVRVGDKTKRLPLTVNELARLLHFISDLEDEFEKHSVRALLLSEAFGGPRVSESVATNFEDIDWDTGIFHIRRGKGDKPRDTVLIPAALDELAWLRSYQKCAATAPLFVNTPHGRGAKHAGQRITRNTAWRWLSKLGAEVGVHVHPHRLRHTAGTLAEQFGSPAYRRAVGLNLDQFKDAFSMGLLGHNSARVNADYNSIPLSEVRKVMEVAYHQIKSLSEGMSTATGPAA